MKIKCGRLIAGGERLLRQMCTAATKLAEPEAERSAKKVSLYRKLSALDMTGRTVSQTLNQCIMEGKVLRKDELQRCVKELRKYRKYRHALEIMEWMEYRGITFSTTDFSLYLDLLSLTKGVAAAESYFSGLPPRSKSRFTYGTLLNCYCRGLLEDKALALFENMDELNFVTSDLPFSNLMCLYMRLGKPEKVPPLIDTMKQRKISMTAPAYHIWMNSYASLNDIEGAERVFEEMKKEDADKINWLTHSNLAAIYVKAKHFDKAESALKMVEKIARPKEREAYHFLLSLYAGIGNQGEVYRVWNYLKSVPPVTNMSYLTMLQSLRRLNDIEGLAKCFEEWKSNCISYDMRLAGAVISAYLSQDLCEEALSVFEEAIKRREAKGPFTKTHENFILFYLGKHKEELAVHHLEAALSEAKDYDGWSPSLEVILAFLKFYEEKKIDGVEKLRQIFKNCNFDDHCLRNYTNADKSALGDWNSSNIEGRG
ncbi:pentatricopeptide repeat-containing protein At1g02370, mitochondrial [Neltuma alba]|uniref:pentatricopeptide repeat-containing protein At1g02370, mitochondrial n=1 Tax=Neltuma alba TaxID=207710 RepID=UPI0010A2F4C0|nr:pentatricopeptide repeat-containing protein At1g02370, mitochondrial-like [Prosopis alba]